MNLSVLLSLDDTYNDCKVSPSTSNSFPEQQTKTCTIYSVHLLVPPKECDAIHNSIASPVSAKSKNVWYASLNLSFIQLTLLFVPHSLQPQAKAKKMQDKGTGLGLEQIKYKLVKHWERDRGRGGKNGSETCSERETAENGPQKGLEMSYESSWEHVVNILGNVPVSPQWLDVGPKGVNSIRIPFGKIEGRKQREWETQRERERHA